MLNPEAVGESNLFKNVTAPVPTFREERSSLFFKSQVVSKRKPLNKLFHINIKQLEKPKEQHRPVNK